MNKNIKLPRPKSASLNPHERLTQYRKKFIQHKKKLTQKSDNQSPTHFFGKTTNLRFKEGNQLMGKGVQEYNLKILQKEISRQYGQLKKQRNIVIQQNKRLKTKLKYLQNEMVKMSKQEQGNNKVKQILRLRSQLWNERYLNEELRQIIQKMKKSTKFTHQKQLEIQIQNLYAQINILNNILQLKQNQNKQYLSNMQHLQQKHKLLQQQNHKLKSQIFIIQKQIHIKHNKYRSIQLNASIKSPNTRTSFSRHKINSLSSSISQKNNISKYIQEIQNLKQKIRQIQVNNILGHEQDQNIINEYGILLSYRLRNNKIQYKNIFKIFLPIQLIKQGKITKKDMFLLLSKDPLCISNQNIKLLICNFLLNNSGQGIEKIKHNIKMMIPYYQIIKNTEQKNIIKKISDIIRIHKNDINIVLHRFSSPSNLIKYKDLVNILIRFGFTIETIDLILSKQSKHIININQIYYPAILQKYTQYNIDQQITYQSNSVKQAQQIQPVQSQIIPNNNN